ncbi:MAG: hypothetical protein R6W67_07045 [Bacteroidales bacterium]
MKNQNSQKAIGKLLILTILTAPLMMVPLQTIGSAGSSTSHDNSFIVIQDTVKQKYDRTFRTVFTDTEDGIEKKIELRYRAGELKEILVNGKSVPQSEFSKYDRVIREAEADAEKIKKDLKAASEEIEKAMQELAKIDFKAMHEEISRSLEKFDQTYMEEVRKAIDQARSEIDKIDRVAIRHDIEESMKNAREELEKARQEMERVRREIIIPEVERHRIMTEEERERFRVEMEKVMQELRLSMEELRKNMRSGDEAIIVRERNSEPTASAEKRETMEKKLEEIENSTKRKRLSTNSRY